MATDTDICNLALSKLGAKAISDLTEDSRNGRACALHYPLALDAELEDHAWSFATQRFQLAADPNPPAFGKANKFALPAGFRRLVDPDPNDNYNDRDWEIESGYIFTDYPTPLNIRAVILPQSTGAFTPLFIEALSSRLARDMAEAITQSNSKKADAEKLYEQDIARAKKANAIQKPPQQAYDDTFITVRN